MRPGIILPDEAGLYALDGSTEVVPMELDKHRGCFHADKGRAVEKRGYRRSVHQQQGETLRLPGKNGPRSAFIRAIPSSTSAPADGREPQFALVRADVKG